MKTLKMTVNKAALKDFPLGYESCEPLGDGSFRLTLTDRQYRAYPGHAYDPLDPKREENG